MSTAMNKSTNQPTKSVESHVDLADE